jgi:branched-chain amino acid transport system ATP-binding protein
VSTPLLSIADYSIAYGTVEAVHDIALNIGDSEIVTVIGANGAGKSTLLNALMGVLPAAGQVRFAGDDIARLEVEQRVELGMCLVPEKRELFASMTVEDNLLLGGYRVSADRRRRGMDDVFRRFPRLNERRRQLAGTLSGGERQMLAMGRALMSSPRLLMLDEPSLGLAPKIVAEIFRIITELRDSGVSILLVEQNARAALRIADRAYMMELGLFTLEGRAGDLIGDARIAESYLGISE